MSLWHKTWGVFGLLGVTLVWVGPTHAGEVIVNPYAPTGEPAVLDFSQPPVAGPPSDQAIDFSQLDAFRGAPVEPNAAGPGQLPPGWVQFGGVVVPQAVAEGADVIAPEIFGSRNQVQGPSAADLCAHPEAVPPGIYSGVFRKGTEFPRHGTVYMNYTGGMFTNGGENSAENQSTLAKAMGIYPVYKGGETKAIAVAQAVANDFAELAVRVVYLKRPPKRLPYVMVMMGGHYSDTVAGPSGGVAPGADCEDTGLRNVCYAFVNYELTNSQANTASQEIGHTMGLGHTYGKDRVMAFGYDAFSSIDMGFGDECSTVLTAQGQGSYCAGVNKCHCASDGKQQHDLNTLRAIYADPGPDNVPPTIAITSPEDGAKFQPDETIIVEVDPWDNFGGYGWDLTVTRDNEEIGTVVDYQLSQQFLLKGLPPGTYTLTTRIQDHADQIGEDAISVTVIDPDAPSETPTTSDSDSDDSDASGEAESAGDSEASASSSSSSSDSETDTAGPEQDGADDGCSCRETPRPTALVWLGILGLAARRRRRGSARC